jgi:hypothetical protein
MTFNFPILLITFAIIILQKTILILHVLGITYY